MNSWPSCKGKQVLKALLTIGWDFAEPARQGASHRKLVHPHLPDFVWSLADEEDIGPVMLGRIGTYTGLQPEDF